MRLLPTPLADLPTTTTTHSFHAFVSYFATGCDSTTFVVLIIRCQWYIGRKKVGSPGDLASWSYNNISPPFMINSSTLKEEERAIFRGRNKSVLYSANISVRLVEHSEEQREGFCRSGPVDCKSGLSLCHCSKKEKKKKPCIMVDWLQ